MGVIPGLGGLATKVGVLGKVGRAEFDVLRLNKRKVDMESVVQAGR